MSLAHWGIENKFFIHTNVLKPKRPRSKGPSKKQRFLVVIGE